jgi:hypothetical protein
MPFFTPDPPGSPLDMGPPQLALVPNATVGAEAWAVSVINASFQDAFNPLRFVYKNTTLWYGPTWQSAEPLVGSAIQAAEAQGPFPFKASSPGLPGGFAGGPALGSPSGVPGGPGMEAPPAPQVAVQGQGGSPQQEAGKAPAAPGATAKVAPGGGQNSETNGSSVPAWVWALVGVTAFAGASERPSGSSDVSALGPSDLSFSYAASSFVTVAVILSMLTFQSSPFVVMCCLVVRDTVFGPFEMMKFPLQSMQLSPHDVRDPSFNTAQNLVFLTKWRSTHSAYACSRHCNGRTGKALPCPTVRRHRLVSRGNEPLCHHGAPNPSASPHPLCACRELLCSSGQATGPYPRLQQLPPARRVAGAARLL